MLDKLQQLLNIELPFWIGLISIFSVITWAAYQVGPEEEEKKNE